MTLAKMQKPIHLSLLLCFFYVDDVKLPIVSPITISVPHDYPEQSAFWISGDIADQRLVNNEYTNEGLSLFLLEPVGLNPRGY